MIRDFLGDSLWKDFQKSRGELSLEVRECRKRERAALMAAVIWFLKSLYLHQALSDARDFAFLKS